MRCVGCARLIKHCNCAPLSLRTIQIGIDTNPEQKQSLLKTMEGFNMACNEITRFGKMSEFDLHGACYYELKRRGFNSQISMNAIKSVSAAWKHAETQPEFDPHSSVHYDGDGLKVKNGIVGITTLDGRLKLPLRLSEFHKERLSRGRICDGGKLCWRKGMLFIAVTIEEESPEQAPIKDVLGIDRGRVNIAWDSKNNVYTNPKIEEKRRYYKSLRGMYQKVKTKNSRRHLVKLSGRERRFKKDVNHCVSKALVQTAKGTSSAIALEDLKGIRKRTTVRRNQRDAQQKWAYYELGTFVDYKALKDGVPVVYVNPRRTSRRCPACGKTSKKNRVSRDLFKCIRCGYDAPADYVGALNIRTKGARKLGLTGADFNLPMAALGVAAISDPLGRRS